MFPRSKPHYFGRSRCKPVLFRESLQKDLPRHGQKKYFLASEKPGKWLAEDIFSNARVNLENTRLSATISMKATETKFRVSQFKFTHRRIATNDFLLKIGKKETDSCAFCADSPETVTHLFWDCTDQLRLFGIMFCSGPSKILIWRTWTIPPSHQLFASA